MSQPFEFDRESFSTESILQIIKILEKRGETLHEALERIEQELNIKFPQHDSHE
jgi:hypothetical protein